LLPSKLGHSNRIKANKNKAMTGTRWRKFVLKGNYDSSRGICRMSVNPKVLSFVRKNQPFLFLISGKHNLLHGKILIEIWHFLFCKVICGWKCTWQPPFLWINHSIIVPLFFYLAFLIVVVSCFLDFCNCDCSRFVSI
jgi:hypothetical protein